MRTEKGKFKRKYAFHELEIGQTVHVMGRLSAIRTSASQWGKRYGVWLKVEKALQGANVTRIDSPKSIKKENPVLSLEERFLRMEDALRFISLMVIQIKEKLQNPEE